MRLLKSFAMTILIASATVGITVTSATAALITIPSGLNIGDRYRLAFVTSGVRDATSSNIFVYNSFVTGQANSNAALVALGATWKAIASTANADARGNTSTNPNTSAGFRIFNTQGQLVANNNSDLWDGTLAAPISFDQNGNLVNRNVWTGTRSSGAKFNGRTLGLAVASQGLSTDATFRWVQDRNANSLNRVSLYAISSVITVTAIPLPATLPLYGTGMVVMGFIGWRRKRQAKRV